MSLSAKSFSLFKRDVVLFVTNLMTGVVIARTLGPESLGLWVILQMILGYAESFGRLKLDYAAIYFLGRNKCSLSEVVVTLNLVAVVTSALIVALIWWQFERLYGLLFAQSPVDVRIYMAVILIQIPLQFLSLNYSYLHIYREDVGAYNGMIIIRSMVSTLLAITLLLVFKMGLTAVVASSILSVLLGLLFGAYRLGRIEGKPRLFNFPLLRDLISYGFMIYIAGIVGQLNTYVTRLVVVFHMVPAQVAYFAMAQNQGQLLNKVPEALNVLLYSRISKIESQADAAKLTARTFRVVLLILIAAGAIAFFAIDPAVRILYGERFAAMVLPFRIILPGLILSGATTTIDQYFSGIGRVDLGAKIAVVPLIAQTVAAVLLIPPMGLVGAALAFVTALLALATAQMVTFLRISTCSVGDLRLQADDFKVVIAFITAEFRKVFNLQRQWRIS